MYGDEIRDGYVERDDEGTRGGRSTRLAWSACGRCLGKHLWALNAWLGLNFIY
jgi:hypothetical protein